MEKLKSDIFLLSSTIRYVALYRKKELIFSERPDLKSASGSESDKYEELLVNPVLLKLANQRGDIDCGGAEFIIVGYGNFLQLIIDRPDGHISIAFEKSENPLEYIQAIKELIVSNAF